jgi:hypothetical protein
LLSYINSTRITQIVSASLRDNNEQANPKGRRKQVDRQQAGHHQLAPGANSIIQMTRGILLMA